MVSGRRDAPDGTLVYIEFYLALIFTKGNYIPQNEESNGPYQIFVIKPFLYSIFILGIPSPDIFGNILLDYGASTFLGYLLITV